MPAGPSSGKRKGQSSLQDFSGLQEVYQGGLAWRVAHLPPSLPPRWPSPSGWISCPHSPFPPREIDLTRFFAFLTKDLRCDHFQKREPVPLIFLFVY